MNIDEMVRKSLEESKKKYKEYVDNLIREHGSKYKEELRRRELDEQQRKYEEDNK